MFTIGDFARHGRVSVRMLRHYDATGLLRRPTSTPSTATATTPPANSPASTGSSR
ncbi:hypothetical protein QFZ63_000432 [Streptomyces sp. B3I7]|nr:hypothetical protein [Streptomyces sp. B3I7]